MELFSLSNPSPTCSIVLSLKASKLTAIANGKVNTISLYYTSCDHPFMSSAWSSVTLVFMFIRCKQTAYSTLAISLSSRLW